MRTLLLVTLFLIALAVFVAGQRQSANANATTDAMLYGVPQPNVSPSFFDYGGSATGTDCTGQYSLTQYKSLQCLNGSSKLPKESLKYSCVLTSRMCAFYSSWNNTNCTNASITTPPATTLVCETCLSTPARNISTFQTISCHINASNASQSYVSHFALCDDTCSQGRCTQSAIETIGSCVLQTNSINATERVYLRLEKIAQCPIMVREDFWENDADHDCDGVPTDYSYFMTDSCINRANWNCLANPQTRRRRV